MIAVLEGKLLLAGEKEKEKESFDMIERLLEHVVTLSFQPSRRY